MVAGGSFAIAQHLSSNPLSGRNRLSLSLAGVLVRLTLFLKRWQPVRIFRFGDMGASQVDQTPGPKIRHVRQGKSFAPRSPFLFLTATVTSEHTAVQKRCLPLGGALYDWVINVPVPYLDKLVARMPPVVHEVTAYAAVYKFDWFSRHRHGDPACRAAVYRLVENEALSRNPDLLAAR